VIGYDAWAQLFGRRAHAIGSTVSVSGVTVTIVGVAPPGFSGVGGYNRLHLWMLVSARPLLMPEPFGEFRAVARLKPGVSLRSATTAAQVVATRAGEAAPELSAQDPSVDVVTLLASNGEPMFERDVRLMLLSLGLVGLLILAITITNVSALLTGLAAARRQEIAARMSLGAARLRVIRQLLTESALLASIAAAAALFIVWAVFRLGARFVPELTLQLEITWQAAFFALGTALAVGVGFGLSPALHATRLAIATTLRDACATIVATRARLQRGLVVAQIAFTQPLIVLLAALLIVVIGEFRPARTDGDRLIGVSLSFSRPPSRSGYGDWQIQMRESMRRLNERLKATPGIAAVAMIDAGERTLGSYTVHPEQAAAAMETAVPLSGVATAEGYFAVNGLDIIRGRDFLAGEVWPAESRAGETPVIIDADLARRLWAGDPLGHRLRAATDSASLGTFVIVGVVDAPRDRRRAGGHRIYLPPDTSIPFGFPMVRTIASAQPLLPLVRRIIDEETPAGVATNVSTFAEIEQIQRRELRVALGGVSTAGLLALLLSAIGLYAVVAFSVAQRTGEIAVRIAIGGRIHQIVRKFIGDGLRLSLFGLVFGLPASLLGFRILITNVDIPDVPLAPVTAMAAVGLLLVALAAVWIPARRAASVHPAAILRRE
jgi:predicted permease